MKSYEDFKEHLQELTDIQCAAALMHWDQEVHMPKKGAEFRSRHLSTLSGLSHDKFTDPAFGKLLEKLLTDNALSDEEKLNVQRVKEDFDKEVKLNTPFVKKRSRLISAAYQKWVAARNENDWNVFKEAMKPLVDLKREETELRGYTDHPYQALFDLYEPGLPMEKLDEIFGELKKGLLPIIANIKDTQKNIPGEFLNRSIDEDIQWDWSIFILKEMGYDFDAGRQDRSPHPFTITIAPDDIRVTTRVDKNDLSNILYSSIHEGGHALYEQGLPKQEYYGLPLSEACSLSIHESQSRLWENHVGRSLPFWKAYFPIMQQEMEGTFDDVDVEDFFRAMNIIQANKIRTEADELHYHLHIMIRYEIERDLIAGKIEVNDLKELWNQKYKEYLDVEIAHDNEGILQDVHWAHGGFGYFPTYTLGSLYAAQLFEKIQSELPDLNDQIEQRDLNGILKWLRNHIHQHGRRYLADDLCKEATGRSLEVAPFLKYADRKFSRIYE